MLKLLVVHDTTNDTVRCYVATQESMLRWALKQFAASATTWRMARVEGGQWAWFDGSKDAHQTIVVVPYPLQATVLV